MKKSVVFILITFAVLLSWNVSAVYTGIVDGYIKYGGESIGGAKVGVKVVGCGGGGCEGTAISEDDGYYIVANLNLPKGGEVEITATKDNAVGTARGTANEYSIAHQDVELCYLPSSPALDDVENTHETIITFSWTSGNDPKGKQTYDEFKLDNRVESNVAPPLIRNVVLGKHVWQVRTCNSGCCSDWVSDEFTVGNLPPSKPTETKAEKNNGITLLSWISGIDPEGDSTYDEFQFGNGSIVSPAISPVSVLSDILIKWKVRTCDNLGACSDWQEVDSVMCEKISESCPSSGDVEKIIKTSYGKAIESAKKVGIYCNGIKINETEIYKIAIDTKSKSKVSIYGKNFTLKNLDYCPWCFDGIKDYDEEGVDCGGSCAPCSLYGKAEKFVKGGKSGCKVPWILLLVILLNVIVLIIYLIEKWKKN